MGRETCHILINMSIASSGYADHANQKREAWLTKLKQAHAARDWTLVQKLIAEMADFEFSE